MTQRDLSDTAPDAQRVQFDLYRSMSAAEKMRCMVELSRTADTLALAGLRTRHPDASHQELLLRLAIARYGRDLIARAYGLRATDVT